ncbi:MAG TPA: NAD(P)-dependent oxidoreductase [Sphingomicrobium sp.]
MSRFLVTGATGFIGSAIVRRLLADGHEVVAPNRARLDLLRAADEQLTAFVRESRVSHCIHAAWYTNHADYLTHEINRDWLAASLRLARACHGLRFVGLGTCLEPDTLYGRCKHDLERGLSDEKVNYAWARVFFVYGPGDRAGRLIPEMIERFSRGEATGPTYGGLRRDYIHVDDLAGQIVRIATSDVRGPIDTGTGQAPTLSEVYAAGAEALGRPELAETNDETGGQAPLIRADLTRFRAVVGDPQARDIAAGLRDLIG